MKNSFFFVFLLISSNAAMANAPSKLPIWFYSNRLPDQRISVSASNLQEGKFDCSLYGNFSLSDFQAHFKPDLNSMWAQLVTRKLELAGYRSEPLVTRPCLEWESSDGGPDLCLKFDEYEYRFMKSVSTLALSPTAHLTYECDNYARGRERL